MRINIIPGLRWHRAKGSLVLLAFSAMTLLAGERSTSPPAPAAVCTQVDGALMQRPTQKNMGWQPVKGGDKLAAGATVVALPEAQLRSVNGNVSVEMVCDLGQRGPYPTLEPALQLIAAPAGIDLALRLDRGILALNNLKKEGAARVRVQVPGETWELNLLEPGTKVALELYGRFPPGIELFENKVDEPVKIHEVPTLDLVVVVVKGKVALNTGKVIHGLSAPPGDALLFWDNLAGVRSVQYLAKLPGTIRPSTPEEAARFQKICTCTAKLNTQPIETFISRLLSSNQEGRRVGIVCAGALDRLPDLIGALMDSQHADERDAAVIALRHWMGRGAGQAERLYQALVSRKGISVVEARTILQLLIGFDDQERQRADTFELLLAYMEQSDLPIRQIAWWHLRRLAGPAGTVKYDAGQSLEERRAALAELHRLIPAGTVPAAPKADPKKLPLPDNQGK